MDYNAHETPNLNRPYVPVGSHPIEQGDYILDTISINELYESVLQWIKMREPGAIVYSSPRIGKTYAIKYIMRIFEIKYKNQWDSFFISSRYSKTTSEDKFFQYFLKDVGHSLYSVGKAGAKRDRLINYLLDKADQTIRNQIVIFYDDAQRLKRDEYEWLMDIYNELQNYGITITTILVGQEELKQRRSVYLTSSKQIIGRFMIHQTEFFGVRNSEELAYILAGYDLISEYPPESKCSYTKYFFPIAFESGARLEVDAEKIWKCIENMRRKNGLTKKPNLPMHYMISIINYVLVKFGANEENASWPTDMMWKEAIIESGYIQAEVNQ